VAIALVAAALLVAIGLAAWQLAPREDPTVVKLPTEYPFRCTECGHEWSADRNSVTGYFGGGLPSQLRPVDCPSCGRKNAAFLMARCPWCGKYHIHAHALKRGADRPKEDICPHCGKDTMKWRR
jgi:hypothetical protein